MPTSLVSTLLAALRRFALGAGSVFVSSAAAALRVAFALAMSARFLLASGLLRRPRRALRARLARLGGGLVRGGRWCRGLVFRGRLRGPELQLRLRVRLGLLH